MRIRLYSNCNILRAHSRLDTGYNGNFGTGRLTSIRYGKEIKLTLVAYNTLLDISLTDIIAFTPEGYKPQGVQTAVGGTIWLSPSQGLSENLIRPIINSSEFIIKENGYIYQNVTTILKAGTSFTVEFDYFI